jgi:hypothetical protein
MTQPVILPTIALTQGLQFDGYWRFMSNYPIPRSPVNLAQWSGRFDITETASGAVLYSAPLTLTNMGDISIIIAPEITATLNPARQVGGRAAAEFQIKLDAPEADLSQVWQGGVSIARATV